jgi:hypothetical protein
MLLCTFVGKASEVSPGSQRASQLLQRKKKKKELKATGLARNMDIK